MAPKKRLGGFRPKAGPWKKGACVIEKAWAVRWPNGECMVTYDEGTAKECERGGARVDALERVEIARSEREPASGK